MIMINNNGNNAHCYSNYKDNSDDYNISHHNEDNDDNNTGNDNDNSNDNKNNESQVGDKIIMIMKTAMIIKTTKFKLETK